MEFVILVYCKYPVNGIYLGKGIETEMNSLICLVLCGPMLLKCQVTQDYSVFIVCIINIIVFYFTESIIELICLLYEEIMYLSTY